MQNIVDLMKKRVELELNDFKEFLFASFIEMKKNNGNAIRDPTNNMMPKKYLNQLHKQLKRKDLSIDQKAGITGFYNHIQAVIEKEVSEENVIQLMNRNSKSKGRTMRDYIKKAR